jgi:hypothetical protein
VACNGAPSSGGRRARDSERGRESGEKVRVELCSGLSFYMSQMVGEGRWSSVGGPLVPEGGGTEWGGFRRGGDESVMPSQSLRLGGRGKGVRERE